MTAFACVLAGLGFGVALWLREGPEPAQQYLAGYLIELSLSVDNVFVFALVFRQFGVEPRRRSRLLFWGIAGAILLRSLFLVAGVAAIRRFAWIIPLFGAFVLATGVRLAIGSGRRKFDPSGHPVVGFVVRHVPAAVAALVALETADLIFALDSLPAVLAVTRDATIAVTSNVFAIIGLRSLYFVVSGAMEKFRHLGAGLAAVLCFVGAKMMAEPWIRVPTPVSLVVIAILLGVAVAASLPLRTVRR
jgi:tellurite resistance protein TerC